MHSYWRCTNILSLVGAMFALGAGVKICIVAVQKCAAFNYDYHDHLDDLLSSGGSSNGCHMVDRKVEWRAQIVGERERVEEEEAQFG